MFMLPVYSSAASISEPLTLDEAIGSKVLSIDETSAAGAVPELALTNRSSRTVFLLDGEQVIGVKQNRTFNLSMLLPAESNTVVPVSCLESGRWDMRKGAARSAEHVHFATGRANKLRSVTASLSEVGSYRSDQGRVWSDIEAKFSRADRMSPTAAESEYFEQRRDDLEPHLQAFNPQAAQCGAIIGIGKQIVGVDLFATAQLYHRVGMKLLKSYLLDALESTTAADPVSKAAAAEHVAQMFAGRAEQYPAPGLGETHRWSAPAGSAAALIVAGRCVHAVAFSEAEYP
jgi:hypothetical protein